MKVKRNIQSGKYLLAFILTSLIFFLGLTMGMLFDNLRVKSLETKNQEQELDYLSLQFQFLYLGSLDDKNASCTVLRSGMKKTINDLSKSLETFTNFKKDTKINKKEYDLVGRRYLLDNLKYWLFATKTKKECDFDVVTILYFYSEEKCPICPNQGVVLTYFKRIFGDSLLVFPINVDYEESSVQILTEQYSVNSYPTLIVEDAVYEGVVNQVNLKKIICNSFKHEKDECA